MVGGNGGLPRYWKDDAPSAWGSRVDWFRCPIDLITPGYDEKRRTFGPRSVSRRQPLNGGGMNP